MGDIVLVCGDRRWAWNPKKNRGWAYGDGIPTDPASRADYDLLLTTLRGLTSVNELVEGEAFGADQLSGQWAKSSKIKLSPFEADWAKFHKAAGQIRNSTQLAYLIKESTERGLTARVIAFHRNIAQSKGTGGMVAKARKAGVPVEIYPEGQE